jgi:hypothetical protein
VIDPSQYASAVASLAVRLGDRVEIIAHRHSPWLEKPGAFLEPAAQSGGGPLTAD